MEFQADQAGRLGDAVAAVRWLLGEAVQRGASDVHLEPSSGGYEVRFRIDGLLAQVARVEAEVGRAMVGRLMVMAELLTYRLDVPQEGRLSIDATGAPGGAMDLRLAIMPTTHGLRAAVRLPAELTQPRALSALGLPDGVTETLRRFARRDDGMLLLTGPAGSGKTTTIYALLEYIAAEQPGLSIVTLEDPVERDLAGVTQIEVKPFGELSYERALRSILRQDPQVLMLGEVRDAATASIAVQAALSGHRLITTLHAGDPAAAAARLLEMGLAPYQITSALFAVVSQRLLRRRAEAGADGDERSGRPRGRVPVAECAVLDEGWRQAILAHGEAGRMRARLRSRPEYRTIMDAAHRLIETGVVDAAEVQRVLGDAAS